MVLRKRLFTCIVVIRGCMFAPIIWREIDNFSSGAVCMVLASECYDELDYYRGYDEFISGVKKR